MNKFKIGTVHRVCDIVDQAPENTVFSTYDHGHAWGMVIKNHRAALAKPDSKPPHKPGTFELYAGPAYRGSDFGEHLVAILWLPVSYASTKEARARAAVVLAKFI